MQELVLVLGSVAGACTAVALDKIPKRKNDKFVLRANPVIKSQIQSLEIEKDILTKTISRLYQYESELSKIQRDKLLLRYQNQLGLVIAKIEKLEAASKHPDIGPLGDGLVTLMDQKLSQLDKKLHEISSKITVAAITQPQIKQPEPIKEVIIEKPAIKKIETKIDPLKENNHASVLPVEIPVKEYHKSVELITLTEIPNKIPEFPPEFVKPSLIVSPKQVKDEIIKEHHIDIEKPRIREVEQIIEIPKPEPVQPPAEKKIQIPSVVKIPEDEKLEDDDKDIDKIKNEIMKALSKLEQVEVE
ncbi:MAG TPA: hypothetical protein VD699_02650 [Nitrosopumilaceae archaeon]|nr:hypothetical protein [Nitrosopumilaceae archaeon]